ncbi:retrotransposon protein, putative, ty1-copia subclass [Tanacetum coccineum]
MDTAPLQGGGSLEEELSCKFLAELLKKRCKLASASSSRLWELYSQLTPSYTPQPNGVSERRNRTLLNMVRSMMNLTTLPLSFWDYALESATRILNMVPTKKVDKTPYELWYGKVPNLSYLKVWGCEAFVKRDTHDKLHMICLSRIFMDTQRKSLEVSGRAEGLEEIQDEDTSPSEITSKIPMEVEVVTFLVYGGNPEAELRVDCYCNAGFEIDKDDKKSLTGYLHKLNYIAASEAEMEAVWIRKFISGLDDNLADPFTKALPKGKLTQHARSMGLRLASSFM